MTPREVVTLCINAAAGDPQSIKTFNNCFCEVRLKLELLLSIYELSKILGGDEKYDSQDNESQKRQKDI